MNPPNPVIEIKPYSPGELAKMYSVSLRTLNRWLKRHHASIGERDGLYYTALQVKIIFEKLGLPETTVEN